MAKSKRPATPKVDPYLDGLMSKLMERLSSLERKMDTVIAHTTASRASHPAPQAPRPAQQPSFSNPHPMAEPKNLPRHERRTMYEAVCADCSDPCEVPFRPSPDRAIYCKPCFAKRRAEGRVHPQQGGRPQGAQGPQMPQGQSGPASSAALVAGPSVKSADKPRSSDAKAQPSGKKSKPAAAKPAKPSASGKKARKK